MITAGKKLSSLPHLQPRGSDKNDVTGLPQMLLVGVSLGRVEVIAAIPH